MTIDRIQSPSSQYSLLQSSDELAVELGGDPSARVAAMALLSSRESRDAAQDAKCAEEQHLRAQEDAQVRQMHEQADAVRDAGLSQAVGQIVSGEFTMLSAGISSEGGRNVCFGAAKVSEGLGGAGAAGSNYDAAIHEANAVEAGNRAEASKRRLDDLDQGLDQARNFQDTAIDFLRSTSRTASQADQAAIFVRG